MKTEKDLEYYRKNAEEDYLTTPISVLRYISELEIALRKHDTVGRSEQVKKYYALFDVQTGRYLATGLNSTSLNELFKDYSDYKSVDYDDEEEFRTYFNSMPFEDKINFICSDNFYIEEQDEEFEEEF